MTDIFITSAEIIVRVDLFIRVLEQTPPPPPANANNYIWAFVGFQITLISSLSIPIEEIPKVSFKHNFEHCILLITKRFELLMFTQVVRN